MARRPALACLAMAGALLAALVATCGCGGSPPGTTDDPVDTKGAVLDGYLYVPRPGTGCAEGYLYVPRPGAGVSGSSAGSREELLPIISQEATPPEDYEAAGGVLVGIVSLGIERLTSASGYFLFDSLPPGQVEVTAYPEGYAPVSQVLPVQEQYLLVLATSGAPDGFEAAVQARVTIVELGRDVTTNAAGYYVIENVPVGDYVFRVAVPAFGGQVLEVRVRVAPGVTVLHGLNAELDVGLD